MQHLIAAELASLLYRFSWKTPFDFSVESHRDFLVVYLSNQTLCLRTVQVCLRTVQVLR